VRVLHVSSYFAPAFAYGGPPRTILGLCTALQNAGVEIDVFTTTANGDEDLPASRDGGSAFHGVRVRYFPRAMPRRFFGASGMRDALRRELVSFDLVHVHGIFRAGSPSMPAGSRACPMSFPLEECWIPDPLGIIE
jgi:hypothetical protein